MPLVLVVEDGSIVTGANTYQTIDTATAYFEGRTNSGAWTDATEAEQGAALVESYRIMATGIEWFGWPVRYDQPGPHPRQGLINRQGDVIDPAAIAPEILWGQAEIALSLLEGARTGDAPGAGFDLIKVGPITLEPNRTTAVKPVPHAAWSILSIYGKPASGGLTLQVLRG